MCFHCRQISVFGVPLGLIPATALAQSTSTNNDGGSAVGVIVGVIYLAIIIAWIVWFFQNRKPFQVGSQTSLSQADVVQRSIQTYTMSGYQVLTQNERGASFVKRQKPGCLSLILFFAMGIIPGIIYLAIGGRDLTANVSCRSTGPGVTVMEIAGNAQGFGAKRAAEKVLQGMPLPSSTAHSGETA